MRTVLIVLVVLFGLSFIFVDSDKPDLEKVPQSIFDEVAQKNVRIGKSILNDEMRQIDNFYNSMPVDSILTLREIETLDSLMNSFLVRKQSLNLELSSFQEWVYIDLPEKYQKVFDWYNAFLYDYNGAKYIDSIRIQFVNNGYDYVKAEHVYSRWIVMVIKLLLIAICVISLVFLMRLSCK